jgi:alpha-tubulin suppressor-like RCC1 family protein
MAVHSVFLATNGKLYSWGPNEHYCLGHNEPAIAEIVCPELYEDGGFTDFAAGVHHNLVLTTKSRIFVWGRNEDGQLGLGHKDDVEIPTLLLPFPDAQTPARVYCGAHFSTVLTEDGSVYTMGYNDNGQLGHGTIWQEKIKPKKVQIPTPVAHIACGWCSVFAFTKSGQTYVWGDNHFNKLQFPSDITRLATPTLCPSLSNLTNIQPGIHQVSAIQEGGTLLAWGEQKVVRVEGWTPTTLPLVPPQPCIDIACGSSSSFALGKDGALFSWGTNANGELGSEGPHIEVTSPKKVLLPQNITQIAFFGGAANQSFLLSEQGDLYLWGAVFLWGKGVEGELGTGITSVPTLLQNWKWALPKSYIWAKWNFVVQWLFLGRLDNKSPFHSLHVEIIFNFVTLLQKSPALR